MSTPAPSPSRPRGPPIHIPHEETGSDIIVEMPKNLRGGPLKLGKLLQQETSDLWTKVYNEISTEYQQDLGCVDNASSDEPEG